MNEMTASLSAKAGELEARERLVEETTVQLNQATAKVSVQHAVNCLKQFGSNVGNSPGCCWLFCLV